MKNVQDTVHNGIDMIKKNRDSIRLVACDLDGTLLQDTHVCSTYTINVWEKLQNKGIHFVPITGRPFPAMKHHVPIDLCQDVICTNGVHIYGRSSLDKQIELVKSTDLAWSTAKDIIHIRDSLFPDVHLHLYQKEAVYSLQENEYSKTYSSRTSLDFNIIDTWQLIENIPVSKMMFISWDNALLHAIKDSLGDIDGIHSVFSSKEYLEIFSAAASKGLAIQFLLDKYNLTSDSTMAFGDSYNDIPMFDVSQYGYIMKNADQDLLPHLPRTKYTNNEDGVARLLQEFLLED